MKESRYLQQRVTFFIDMFVNPVPGYGLTETGFNSGNNGTHYKPGSCGVSPTGVHIKVKCSLNEKLNKHRRSLCTFLNFRIKNESKMSLGTTHVIKNASFGFPRGQTDGRTDRQKDGPIFCPLGHKHSNLPSYFLRVMSIRLFVL